jgi:hypothetical protein
MPSLADADTVMASEAIKAAPIRAMRLIEYPPVRVIATSCTSLPGNVCSAAHEVKSDGALSALFGSSAAPMVRRFLARPIYSRRSIPRGRNMAVGENCSFGRARSSAKTR